MLIDLAVGLLVVFVGGLLLIPILGRYTAAERPFIVGSFFAHVLAAFGQIFITRDYYAGAGDMMNYLNDGNAIAHGLSVDWPLFSKYWLHLLLQNDDMIGVLPLQGAGNATGSMTAISAALCFVLGGSIYGVTLSIAIAAMFGKLALYRVFRDLLPVEMRARLLVATLLVPSVVLWSSGVLKESVAIIGVGAACLGVHRFLNGKRITGLILAACGPLPIALVKPYILFPLVLATATWIYTQRLYDAQGRTGTLQIRPIWFLVAAAVGFAGLVGLMQLYPVYSIDNLGEDFGRYQYLGAVSAGGSYYAIGDEGQRSLSGQVAFVPIALATSLFRPFIFEVKNVLALVSALEMTAFTLYVARTIFMLRPTLAFRLLLSRPILPVAVVFTLSFGTAVGLATTNFGSLSRYRMPLMPFYAAVVLVLGAPAAASRLIRRAGDGPVDRVPAPARIMKRPRLGTRRRRPAA